MKQNLLNIDYEWLTKETGDPFADVGGYVIKYLSQIYPEKNILELIEFAAKLYVNNWKVKPIYTFFPNSKITLPNFKGEDKIKKTVEHYSDLINEKKNFQFGFCRLSGRKANLFSTGKDEFIMAGSGDFVNFHHFFQNGLMLSKEIIIRMFFIPLGVEQLFNKMALSYSNDKEITEIFIKNNFDINIHNISIGLDQKIKKSEFNNPANALFEYARYAIRSLNGRKNVSIQLYHFTNFNQGPEINLYNFPAPLFNFYKNCLSPDFEKDWQEFVNRYYHPNKDYKNAVYNPKKSNFELVTKDNNEFINHDIYKTWYNPIYQKLINSESILKDILYYSEKGSKFDFRLVTYYQTYIRKMEHKTLEKIKELAEFIISSDDNDKIKKAITRLNLAKRSFELRMFLLTLIKENFNKGNKKPLITIEEYVEYLFPDGTIWSEIRDLLLIAIYQKLHEKNISFEIEIPETELETIKEE